MKQATQNRLIIALVLAQNEIHNPGTNRNDNIDIVALIEGVLKEASKSQDLAAIVREELVRLRSVAA